MTLKQKILLLGAVPVLLMALVVNLSNYMVSKRDLESDLVVARENAIKERKALLSSYIMMAKTAVDAVYSLPDSPENRRKVKELLRPLRYSSDGYFFVYDFEGNTILLPVRTELEGKNRWNDKDAKGKLLNPGDPQVGPSGGWFYRILDGQALHRSRCSQTGLYSGVGQIPVGHWHRFLYR